MRRAGLFSIAIYKVFLTVSVVGVKQRSFAFRKIEFRLTVRTVTDLAVEIPG